MGVTLLDRLAARIEQGRRDGVHKTLLPLASPVGRRAHMADGTDLLLLCANDYLGMADDPKVRAAAQDAVARFGAGTGSVRFICGTNTLHVELEAAIAAFLGMPSATTFSSCWSANTALLPAITQPDDVVLSDALNHASIIDACRLMHRDVVRAVYHHADMSDLRAQLQVHRHAPARLIVTDGVFSMEGDLARLPDIIDLARTYDAIVVVDDSHGLGVAGATGRGAAEALGVHGAVDIYTGTLGKALGAGTGGFVAGPVPVVEAMVQYGRPHLFSNAVAPAVAGAALASLGLLQADPSRVTGLRERVYYFAAALRRTGVEPLGGEAAILAVIVGETAAAIRLSARLREEGVFAIGFGHPVVPEGTARIRFQVSASHTEADLDAAAAAFLRARMAIAGN